MRIRRQIAALGASFALLTVTAGPTANAAAPFLEGRFSTAYVFYSNCPVDEPAEVECLAASVSASLLNERWGEKRFHYEGVSIDVSLIHLHADGSYESRELDRGFAEQGVDVNGLKSLRSQGSMTMDGGTPARFNIRLFGFGPVTRYSVTNYYEERGCPPRYAEAIAVTFTSSSRAKPAGFVTIDGTRLLPGGWRPIWATEDATIEFAYESGDCVE